MKVVITGTDFSDVDIERSLLEPAGWNVVATDTTEPDGIVEAAAEAEALLVQYATIDDEVLSQLQMLRIISRYGTGVDNIDLVAAAEHDVVVANVPIYGGDEVAVHATSLILAMLRHLPQFQRAVRSGVWDHLSTGPLTSPAELTLGVLGLGRIGRVVAERAGIWFDRVVGHDIDPTVLPDRVRLVELDELFELADVVSLHLPLTDATRQIVDRRRLRLLGPEGVVVNTARGDLVLLDDLLDALDANEIAGAALDVLTQEPPPADHPVLSHPSVLVTPHTAWYSTAAEVDIRRRAAQNVVDWQHGELTNVVGSRD